MCGIVGQMYFSDNARQVDPVLLARMRDTMAHRGPDGSGLWLSEDHKVGLAHRRLAIIDLSDAAAQPMRDGELVVTFNGEIYNHVALRQELERLGVGAWQTDHSDTEVILKAYRAWGIDCVHRFRGMFAFALWDGSERCLWLMRDRIGIKPLYFTTNEKGFAFASEIKALLADASQSRSVDERGLIHYLSFHVTPAPLTLFDGIAKLPGGCRLRVDQTGRWQQERYWDVWQQAGPIEERTDEALAERIREEVRSAVRLHQESDVPVGVFLSGGIDSSTNAAMFASDRADALRTFSIGYRGEFASYPSELPYAHQMAQVIGSIQYDCLLSEDDLLAFLPRLVWHQDEPIADPVCVPIYFLSELARREGVTVCQLGEGADELFFGYPAWRTLRQIQQIARLPVPRVFKRFVLSKLRRAGRDQSRYFEWLRRDCEGKPVFVGGFERFFVAQKERLLSPQLRARFGDLSSWDAISPIWEDFRNGAWEPSIANWMSYVDLRYRLPELLLMRVDKMSMAASLEARVPFLDHKVVELAFSIPSERKVQAFELKRLLKRAVRGLIPDSIIDRRKQGFGVPVTEFLVGRLGEHVATELRRFCRETEYFNEEYLEQLLVRGDGGALWTLFNLALWWRMHIRNETLA